jgi:hypothetical protein
MIKLSVHRRHLVVVLVLPIAVGVLALPVVSARSQGTDKTVFVAVTDAAGKPVRDMKVSELAVREDNVNREVVGLKPATQPLYLYILADTSRQAGNQGMMGRETSTGGTEFIRDMRASLIEAVRTLYKLNPDAQTALMEFGQAAITITKFTNKAQDVEKGISRLYPKPDGVGHPGALVDTANALASAQRGGHHLAQHRPGEESKQEPQKILDALRASAQRCRPSRSRRANCATRRATSC